MAEPKPPAPNETFVFRRQPAAVSLGEGLGVALKSWRATWPIWVGPAILLGVIAALSTWATLAILDADPLGVEFREVALGRQVAADDVPNISGPAFLDMVARIGPRLVVVGFASTVLTFIVQAVFIALGVGLLPGRGVTWDGYWWRTGIAFGATFLVGIGTTAIFFGLIWMALQAAASGALPVTIVLFIVAMVVFLWLLVRLWFVTYAAFDGNGPFASIRESWRITKGAAWRVFGWAFLLGILGAAIGWFVQSATNTLGQPVISTFLSVSLLSAWSVVNILAFSILYESQRQRHDPSFVAPPEPPPTGLPSRWTPPPVV